MAENPPLPSFKSELTSKILLYPSLRHGYGMGHLKRCLDLYKRMGPSSMIYIENKPRIEKSPFLQKDFRYIFKIIRGEQWKYIVLDQKETKESILVDMLNHGLVVAIDEGGTFRNVMPYLIDTPLSKPKSSKPNAFIPILAESPKQRNSGKTNIENILITFGGEDPARLGPKVVEKIIEEPFFDHINIDLITGPFAENYEYPPSINILEYIEDLKNSIFRYDLVFTSFGLTAFEARSAGVPVVLVNPTRYHSTLTRINGFFEIGCKKVDRNKLRKYIQHHSSVSCDRKSDEFHPVLGNSSIHDFLLLSHSSGAFDCPVCGKSQNPAIVRFPDRSYFRCSDCSVIYLLGFYRKKHQYGHSYFFEEYKTQYGKSYLEDFGHLSLLAKRRLEVISKLSRKTPSVLEERGNLAEIGCAYGPFLKEAQTMGYTVYGADISTEAVAFVRDDLGIDAVCLDFESAAADDDPFFTRNYEIVAMWFVIEHFEKVDSVLKNIRCILSDNGLFCFSTPNFKGISGRKNKAAFLESSPSDHYTVFSPQSVRKLLKLHGYKLKKMKITGHHPERFPLMKNIKSKMLLSLAAKISYILRLGDTFEVYAEKSRELS
jgi:2-polyprenyl-3-methyl-5-hydroxy-6-metoxy-1,4-benzoquinol methylase/spore coat polysaccharide biosynthesis predicted glycosyltransferase SpsG